MTRAEHPAGLDADGQEIDSMSGGSRKIAKLVAPVFVSGTHSRSEAADRGT